MTMSRPTKSQCLRPTQRFMRDSFPSGNDHTGPFTWVRGDLKFIDQSFGSAQSESQTPARGIAVFHGKLKVGDAGTFIFEHDLQTGSHSFGHGLDVGVSFAAAVVQNIARQFAGGRDKLGLIDESQSNVDGLRPDRLTHPHDILGGTDRDRLTTRRCHYRIPFAQWTPSISPCLYRH